MTVPQREVSPCLSEPHVIRRTDIRPITSIEVDGKMHGLGEHRDFRRHSAFRDFIPEHGRTSFSWVRLREGEVLDDHVHPVSSMILVCSGSVHLTGDVSTRLDEGDTVCVPAGSTHGFRTDRGQQFHGLSIQFEGNGLYEDERSPQVAFGHRGRSRFDDLEQFNGMRLEKHGRNALFQLLSADQFQTHSARRRRFLEALYIWSRYFQRMIHARQAFCSEPDLVPLYADHLRDELGHDAMLRAQHGLDGSLYDPILEGASQWFVNMMLRADEAEKIVIVHMVVESSGCLFGRASRAAFGPQERPPGECYFDLHAQADDDHRSIGRSYLQALPPARFARLIDTCGKAWDQMDLVHQRIAVLTDAA
jgi:quercetin dioxygenase-like cupin family protein